MDVFDERRVVVAGGGGGIGQAVCRAFMQEGAWVTCADLRVPCHTALMEYAKKTSGNFRIHRTDVADAGQCRTLFEISGSVSILVNCAGIQPMESAVPAHELSEEVWDSVMAVNLKGVWLMCKYMIQHASVRAVIINIASVTAGHATRDIAAYAASKGGLIALTRALAVEYAPNIRVVAISPGSVDTPLLRQTLARQSAIPDPDKAMAELGNAYPIGRIVTPEEVARVVLFVASDAASAITGTEIMVDGGVTAQGQWAMRPV